MPEVIKPNFLIVGAARSGTTSLYEWLSGHPEVFQPAWKEPSYFVNGYGIKDWQQYLALFAPGQGKKAVGEASAAYLAAPESPQWIARELGAPRIIMILRDPVRRAMSLYAWMTMEGYEPCGSFEAALDAEPRRMADPEFAKNCPQYFWDYYYFTSGLYAQQVGRYLDIFGKSRVRIYLFEELANNSAALFADVCGFLQIDPTFKPSLRPTNQGRIPRFKKAQYVLRAAKSVRGLGAIASAAMELNRKLGPAPRINPPTERMLREKYRADIGVLAQLLNKDLSAWLD
jgi:hypothetical protein